MEFLNVNQLSERTGVSEARLRYCVENGLTWRDWLVPDSGDPSPERLDITAAIFAALAAKMIEMGCTIDAARKLMKGITAFHRRARNPLSLPLLAEAIAGAAPASVQIGDGTHVKWRLNDRTVGWHRFMPTMVEDEQYEPLLVVAIDVAKVRDMVRGRQVSKGNG